MKKIRNITAKLSLGLLLSCSLFSQAFAYETNGRSWDHTTIKYSYSSTNESAYSKAMVAAAGSWTSTPTAISFSKVKTGEEVWFHAGSDYGKIGWNAVHYPQTYSGTNTMRYSTIDTNTSSKYGMGNYSATEKKGVYTHELGHSLGLSHVTDVKQIMSTSAGGRTATVPGDDDIKGIDSIY